MQSYSRTVEEHLGSLSCALKLDEHLLALPSLGGKECLGVSHLRVGKFLYRHLESILLVPCPWQGNRFVAYLPVGIKVLRTLCERRRDV